MAQLQGGSSTKHKTFVSKYNLSNQHGHIHNFFTGNFGIICQMIFIPIIVNDIVQIFEWANLSNKKRIAYSLLVEVYNIDIISAILSWWVEILFVASFILGSLPHPCMSGQCQPSSQNFFILLELFCKPNCICFHLD